MSQELSDLERDWGNIIRMRDLRDDAGEQSRDELRKALVRARNKAREEICQNYALRAESPSHYCWMDMINQIRAMKEPEA